MKAGNSKQSSSARTLRCCADPTRHGRRAVLSILPFLAAAPPAVAATGSLEIEPFLKSTGAKGILADEEEALLQMRKGRELQARAEFDLDRNALEAEARDSQKGL